MNNYKSPRVETVSLYREPCLARVLWSTHKKPCRCRVQ